MPLPAPKLTPRRPQASAVATKSGRIPPSLRHALRTACHLALHALAVVGAYRLAYLLRFHELITIFPLGPDKTDPGWELYARFLYAITPIWLSAFWYSSRLYSSHWNIFADRLVAILKGSVLATLATLAATYVYDRMSYSRLTMLLALPIAATLAGAAEALVIVLDGFLARHEAARPVLLIGGGTLSREIRDRILRRHPSAQVVELAELPSGAELARALQERPYLEAILLRQNIPHEKTLEAAEACEAENVTFKIIPDLLELRFGEIQIDPSLGLPAYRLEHASMTRMNFLAKRIFDVIFSLAVLLVTAIPLAILVILIRLDSPGPVFYSQKRHGLKGRAFDAFKFRTMVADAESRLSDVQAANPSGAFFKIKDDPRVTRVGKWLRRFSLDEFPQFFNVLRGEMSVVGPRPLAISNGDFERLESDFGKAARKRLNVLPGLTGLWQVSGRSDLSNERAFALDLFYIEHWSLGLDIEIILRTPSVLLSGQGAY